MAFPRRLLRGRGDRRQEASWTPEAVASVEKVKKIINKKYQKRTIIGLATGRADAMSLTLSLVQKLTTNELLIKSYERDSYKQMVNDDAKLRKAVSLYLDIKKLMISETGSSKPSEKNLSDLLNEFDEFRKRIR